MPRSPPQDAVTRFRSDLERLGIAGEPLGIAVSGGSDSLALLFLAHAASDGDVAAATVDHGLRPQSRIEALHVEGICERLGCPHSILDVNVPAGPGGVQAEARQARYTALETWAVAQGLGLVATAHHADDQAETLLMRVQRGSGLAGLGGVRPVRDQGAVRIVRPLLGWSKAELVHVVAVAGVDPAEDASNHDPRFDRTAMRRFLAANPQFEPRRLARSAQACREADEAMDWAAEQLAEDRLTSQGGEWRLDPSDLPRAFRRRLLRRVLAEVRREHGLAGREPEDVEALLSALEEGEGSTLAGVAARPGPVWHFRAAPPRRPTRS